MEKYKKEMREAFKKNYAGCTNDQILRELLYYQIMNLEGMNTLISKLEKNRSNTSKMVWWLIAIPILVPLILLFLFMMGIFANATAF